MGGKDHRGHFWHTPHAKTEFPENIEGREKAQKREEVGRQAADEEGEEGGEGEKTVGFARGVSIFQGSGDFESGWIELGWIEWTGELGGGERKWGHKKGFIIIPSEIYPLGMIITNL